MSRWAECGHEFMTLRSMGMSYARIAEKLGVSKTTLLKWGKEHEERLAEMGAKRLAAFLEQHLMDLESRLRLRGEQIRRMETELAARDFTELDIARLLRLYNQYLEGFRREVQIVKVEVTNPLAAYERILMQILELPEGTAAADVPKLAKELAEGKVDQKTSES